MLTRVCFLWHKHRRNELRNMLEQFCLRKQIQSNMPEPCLEQSNQLKLPKVWTNESVLFISKCTILLQTNYTAFKIKKLKLLAPKVALYVFFLQDVFGQPSSKQIWSTQELMKSLFRSHFDPDFLTLLLGELLHMICILRVCKWYDCEPNFILCQIWLKSKFIIWSPQS